MKLACSVAILTLNSEKTLRKCLDSVSFCDDIVILDGNSTDATRAIAKEYGARVYPQREAAELNIKIENFTEMRIKSFSYAKHDWIFYVDSDEYCEEELQTSIQKLVTINNANTVGRFKRRAIVEGKKIEHAYYYPDWCDRLINRQSGVHFKPDSFVHESFIIPSHIQKIELKGELYAHWPDLAVCAQKDAYYLSLSRNKFIEKIEHVKWRYFLKGMVKNSVRAVKVLCSALWLQIRFKNSQVLPFRYHMRFVVYNLKMAWDVTKWKALIGATWKRIPLQLRIILTLGLLLRLALFFGILLTMGQNGFVFGPNGDALEYVTLAKNILHNGQFSLSSEPPFSPNNFRVPLYPLILLVFGAGSGVYIFAVLFQILCSVVLILVVFKFAQRFFNKSVAIISAGFVAFEPNMIYWPLQLITESMFTFLLFISIYGICVWLYDKKFHVYFWSIFILGIATLIRQVSYPLLFLIPLLSCVATMRQGIILGCRYFITGLAIGFLVISPWFVRNKIVFDSFSYGPSFAVRGVIGKYVEAYVGIKYHQSVSEKYGSMPLFIEDNTHFMLNTAIDMVVSDPLIVAHIALMSGIPFFFSDGWFTIIRSLNPKFELGAFDKTWSGGLQGLLNLVRMYNETGAGIFIVAKIVYAIFSTLALWGLVKGLLDTKTRLISFYLLLIISFFWIGSGLGSYARFRYPIEPFLFIFASLGLTNLKCLKRKKI